ncbi:MAG: F0F1 ATP synthase subunit epsilon [Chloroflexia bacterium]|nr:F0F1 ATP synthase subunit epsilon [Chloroflexia bacterium]MDQ3410701.1 F0F1 ATP synthase subunit epsilon [Chloroflexota bacterium]
MAKLHVEIVTGERVILTEDDVDMVIAPGSDGTLGILPRHAPLISTLDAGELRIKKDGREESIIVFGGFIEVTPEKVIVLADTAERAEEIDLARAEESRRSAQTAITNRESTMELEQAADALRRANIRLRIGQRRGSRRGSSDSG